jgi:hypothetical protein
VIGGLIGRVAQPPSSSNEAITHKHRMCKPDMMFPDQTATGDWFI